MYIPGQHDSSMNIRTVYTTTTQTDFIRTVATKSFFSDISPSDRSMVLGSTHPLVKMSTRNILGGKGGLCVRLTTSPPSRAECHETWEPKTPGNLWATPGLLRDSLPYLHEKIMAFS